MEKTDSVYSIDGTFIQKMILYTELINRTYENTEVYPEPCQTSNMQRFSNTVNYFHKTLHLKYLTGF